MSAPTNQSDGQHAEDALRERGTAKKTWRSMASTLHVKVLLAFVVVALLPLAILALFNYEATVQALTNSANRTLFAAASQTAVRLDAAITADMAVIGTEAQLPTLADYLSLPSDKREDSHAKAQVLDVLRTFAQRDAVFISSYGLLDLQGQNVLDTDSLSKGGDESARDYFRVALETGLAYVSPVEFDTGDGGAYLYFSSVVVNVVTAKPVGVLRARYSAATLQQLLVQDSGLVGPQSYPILLDENGLFLADGLSSPGSAAGLLYKSGTPIDPARAAELESTRRLPPRPVDALLALAPGLADGLARVDSSEPYFSIQRSATDMVPHAAAVTRMQTRPWLVAFLEPQETLLAPARAQARNTAALAAVILLMVSIAAIGVARILTNPIGHLTVVARQVATGNLDAKARIESNDEIGLLAHAFNSMTDQLRTLIASLEQRVADLDLASQALRESDKRHRLVFENSPVSIWEEDFSAVKSLLDDLRSGGVTDLETYLGQHPETIRQCADLVKIVDVNQAALALHAAANREELLAGLANTFTTESFDTFRQELLCLWNGGTEMTSDSVVQTLAGVFRDVTVYLAVCPGYEGTLAKVFVSLADITERKRAEEALSQLTLLQRTILDNVAYGVISTNPDGIVTSFNPAAERLLGYTASDVVGHQTPACWHDPQEIARQALLLSEELGAPIAPGFEVFAARPRRKLTEENEWTFVRKDGSRIPVNLSVTALRGEDAQITGFVGLAYDLTERKRAEEQLRRSEHGLAEAQRIAHLGNWELDLATNALTWSDEIYRIFEIDPKKFGASYDAFLNAIHPEDREIVNKAYTDSVKGKVPYDIVHRLQMADGRIKYVNEICETYYGEDGKPLRSVGTVHDITERKLDEEGLQRLNRELRAISNCNQILMRAEDEQTLLDAICHIVCDEAGYRMAWVGYPEDDKAKSVRPVAWAGVEDGYLAQAGITWADTERGRGPAGTTIRNGKSSCLQDFNSDPSAAPWHDSALQRGYRSCISLPLKDESQNTFGVLTIYSTEPNAFTPGEVRLLEELAGDLAFGITVLRARNERKKAEAILRQSEEALRREQSLLNRIMVTSPVGIAVVSRQGQITFANPQAEAILGLSKEEITQRSYNAPEWHTTAVDGGPFRDEEQPFSRVMATRQPVFDVQHAIVWPDGHRVLLSINGAPIFDAQGEIEGVVFAIEDITERKRAEDELRRNQFGLAEAQRIAHLGSWHMDLATNEVFWSEELYKIYGFDPALPPPLYTESMKLFTSESWEKLSTAIARATETGIPYELELETVNKVGGRGWMLARGELVRDESGAAVGVRGVVMDITGRKRVEENLRRMNERYALSTHAAGLGVWDWDLEKDELVWDDRMYELYGVKREDFAGAYEAWLKGIHPDDRAASDEISLQARRGEREYDTEFRVLWPDGSVHCLKAYGQFVRDAQGEPIRMTGVNYDITEIKQAEASLRDSEEKYRTLIQKIQAAVIVHGADTQILTSNSMAQEILGLSQEQLLGKTAIDPAWHFFREDGTVAPSDEYPVSRVLASRKALRNYVLGVHRPNQDNDAWVLVNADPVFGKENELAQIIVTFIDISERKRVESLLSQREHEYRTLAENAPDVIVRYDREGRRIYVNPEFERVNHLTAQQVLGKTPAELSTNLQPRVDVFTERLMAAMASGTPAKVDLSWTQDGKPVCWFVRVVPEFDAAGKVTSALTIWSDISERKQAEEEIHKLNVELEQRVRERTRELAASEERVRQFFERQLVGMAITSPEKGWVEVNDKLCEMLGYSRDELTRLSWAEMTYPEDLAADVTQFERLLRGEIDSYTLEKRFVRKDGSLVFTNLAVGCVRRADRSVDYVLALLEDITERKQAEESIRKLNQQLLLARDAAEAANKAKSVFLANMSHELRTPLNAVLGFSSLMRRDPLLQAEQRENLDIINRSGEHLLTLINDVLEMAKIEAGRVQVESAPFDLGSLVRDVTDMMHVRAQEKGLKLLIDQSSEFPRYIRGDEGRVRQVLINLLGNAVKFTQHGGVTVRFGLKPNATPARLLIEVEDSGIGVSAEDQKKVFEPFVQFGEAAAQKGTGLGLSIARQFVQLMGGTISFESVLGKGSTFRVELPMEKVAAADVLKPERVARGEIVGLAPGQPEYRILIVEDQVDNQLLLTKLMKTVGFQVKVAENGEQALGLFDSWRPQLIWMDRRMPVMDGLEATRRIRELPGGREVKIVAVTASVFIEQRDEMLRAGMDDFVRKPYRSNEIYECMARQLGVHYTFAGAQAEERASQVMLTSQMLAVLPPDLRSELRDALESLAGERITTVVGRVAAYDLVLYKTLSRLVGNFDYPAILKVLQMNYPAGAA